MSQARTIGWMAAVLAAGWIGAASAAPGGASATFSPDPAAPAPTANAPAEAPSPAAEAGAVSCSRGARVFAFTEGAWWAAKAMRAENGGCRVRYEGYGEDDDEVLSLSNLQPWSKDGPGRPLTACRGGDAVLAYSEEAWWPAKVVGGQAEGCQVRYDGFGPDDDDTLPVSKLRRP